MYANSLATWNFSFLLGVNFLLEILSILKKDLQSVLALTSLSEQVAKLNHLKTLVSMLSLKDAQDLVPVISGHSINAQSESRKSHAVVGFCSGLTYKFLRGHGRHP